METVQTESRGYRKRWVTYGRLQKALTYLVNWKPLQYVDTVDSVANYRQCRQCRQVVDNRERLQKTLGNLPSGLGSHYNM